MIKALCIGDSHTAGFPEHDPMFGGNVQSSYPFWLTKKLKEMDCEKNSLLLTGVYAEIHPAV